MRIVICEDEVLIAEHLKSLLINFGYYVEGVAHNFKDSIRLIDTVRPDFALLDIRMEGRSDGIEIARHITKHYNTPFIFITALSDRATIDHALAVNPYGYLVKPFDAMEVYTAIQIALQKYNCTKDECHIVVRDGLNDVKVFENQIMYVKSENIYVDIKTFSKTFTLRKPLELLATELKSKFFIKCHRSYIINLNFVDQIKKDHLIIKESVIPVSRKYQKGIRDIFNNKPFM